MIDYQLDLIREIATTRVSGRLRFAELANHLHRLLRDPDFRVGFDAIIIAEDVAAVLPPMAVTSFGPLIRAWVGRRAGTRWAFVLPTPEMLQYAERTLREAALRGIAVRCFATEALAREWVIAERRAAQCCTPLA